MTRLGIEAPGKAPPPQGRAASLRALFPDGIAIALSDPQAPQKPLWPEEAGAIAKARPSRVREFAAGRAAARAAMADLGHDALPVRMGEDRAPIWPAGITGSISHTGALCIAALGHGDRVRSIGVDLEEAAPLDGALIPAICTLAERAWLASQPRKQRGLLARLIFCAKECAYKCQYPLTRTLFDFGTLEVTPDLDTGQFEATFTAPVGAFDTGSCLPGRFVIEDGLIACGMVLFRRPRFGLGQ